MYRGTILSKSFKRLARPVLAAALALGLAAVPAWAMRVQPMTYELTPSGRGATQDVRVENTDSTPLPVELHVERRHIGVNGEDLREPADDDFLIFPPQGIVPANGFQNFRIQYIGDPAITQTALYVITVAQLPVDTTDSETSGVKFLFNLGTSVAVSPVNTTASVVTKSVEPAETAGMLKVTVVNEGKRFARLHSGVWTFASQGKSETLDGEALRAAVAQPLIEPGATRVIELPVSEGFARVGATASFAYAAPQSR